MKVEIPELQNITLKIKLLYLDNWEQIIILIYQLILIDLRKMNYIIFYLRKSIFIIIISLS